METLSNMAPLFTDLLESLAQNGKPPDENGDGPTMRHRGDREQADGSTQGPTGSAKPYTAEQLDAVRKSVHVDLFF